MSFTTTTNYGLQKPDVSTELDAWGDDLNANWDIVSTQMKLNADAAAAASTLAGTKAPLASPTFTGIPAAPTAAAATNTTQLATTAFVTAAVAAIPGGGGSGTTIVENPKTASYTLLAADAGKMVTFNSASTCTCTINSSVFAADAIVEVIQLGAGLVLFAGTATQRALASADRMKGRYGHASIWFVSATEYVLFGDVEPPTP